MVPAEGIVIAIHGPWGSGKSSVLNFLRHYIEQEPEDGRPIVLRFSPWWYSGREDLTRLFFGQLRARLGDKDFGEVKSRLADLADLLSKIPALPGREAGEFIADKLRGEPDLDALKEKVSAVLKEEGKKILVIIDDVDRLAPAEVRDLFRMIKAVANFPNIIYLLAFEKEIVANALEQEQGIESGKRYLEKIVQGSFDLPPIQQIDLRRMFFDQLGGILTDPQERFNEHYWTNVYFSGIDDLLNTPRQVTRLINALRVTYPAVEEEVDPVDFVALEAFRVFEPEMYRIVRDHKDRFAGNPRERERDPVWGEDEDTIYDQWLNEVSDDNRDAVRGILSSIFPKFAAQFGGSFYSAEYLTQWRKQRRIRSPDVFHIYFRLSVSRDDVSDAEMRELLASIVDPDEFDRRLVEFSEDIRRDGTTRARVVIDRLNDYAEEEIAEDDIPYVVEALFRVGSELMRPEDRGRGMSDFGNDIRLSRLLFTLLRRFDERDRRYEILREAIEDGYSVSLADHHIGTLCQQQGRLGGEAKPEERWLITADQLDQLEDVVLDMIRDAADDDTLLDEPELWSILGGWLAWTDEKGEVRDWVEARIEEDDEALLRLLEAAKKEFKAQTLGSFAIREQPRLNPQWFDDLLDVDDIIDRVRGLDEHDDLPQGQEVAVQQFVTEYELIQQGEDPDAYYRRNR
jgi:predicted KAP-like P-loop ATPase